MMPTWAVYETSEQEILFRAALEMGNPQALLVSAILAGDIEDAKVQLEQIEQTARVALIDLIEQAKHTNPKPEETRHANR